MSVKSFRNFVSLLSIAVCISLPSMLTSRRETSYSQNTGVNANYISKDNPEARELFAQPNKMNSAPLYHNENRKGGESSPVSLGNSTAQQYITYFKKIKQEGKTKSKKGNRKLGFFKDLAVSQLNNFLGNTSVIQPYVDKFFGSFTDELQNLAKENKKKAKKKRNKKKLNKKLKNNTKKQALKAKIKKGKKGKKQRAAEKSTSNVETKAAKKKHTKLKAKMTAVSNIKKKAQENRTDPLKTLDKIYDNDESRRKLTDNNDESAFKPFNSISPENWGSTYLQLGALSLGAGALAKNRNDRIGYWKLGKIKRKAEVEAVRKEAFDHLKLDLKGCEDMIYKSIQNLKRRDRDLNIKIDRITNEFETMNTGCRPGEKVVELSPDVTTEEVEENNEEDVNDSKDPLARRTNLVLPEQKNLNQLNDDATSKYNSNDHKRA